MSEKMMNRPPIDFPVPSPDELTKAVEDCKKRMETYTPEQRKALADKARAMMERTEDQPQGLTEPTQPTDAEMAAGIEIEEFTLYSPDAMNERKVAEIIHRHNEPMRKEIAELKAALRLAVNAIGEILIWDFDHDTEGFYCAFCGADKPDHSEDCKRKLALTAAKECGIE